MKTIIVMFMALLLTGCWEYSQGVKVGTIIKFTQQGAFCKTWEATIVRGGFTDGSGVAGTTVSYFTVTDLQQVPIVKLLMENQTEVKVTFRSELFTFCRSDSDNVFLTSIEPLRK